MSTPLNPQAMFMAPPQGQSDNPLPAGFVCPQPQGLVQSPYSMCLLPVSSCQMHAQAAQQQIHMLLLMLMQMQAQGCTCVTGLATTILTNRAFAPSPHPPPPTGASDTNSSDSQLQQPCSAPVANAHGVSSSIHMSNLNPSSVPSIPMVSSSILMPNSTPIPDPLPNHSQPDPFFMLNNNMHIGTPQYALSQHIAFAAASQRNTTQNPAQGPSPLQTPPYLQCFQSSIATLSSSPLLPSTHNLHLNNHQILPPYASIAGVPTHNNIQAMSILPSSSSCSAPPMPPYPMHNLMLPMHNTSVPNGVISIMPPSNPHYRDIVADGHVQNEGHIANQLIPSHPSHSPLIPEQTHFISPPLPSQPHPSVLSNPAFPSNTASTAQTFAALPFMGQNVAEMSQMAVAHVPSNTALQGAGLKTSLQDPQYVHQAQQNLQPGSIRPSEGSSNEGDGSNKNSHALNDMPESQNRASSRVFSLGTGYRGQASGDSMRAYANGGRLNMNGGRWDGSQRKSDPEGKAEACEPNFSHHVQERSKGGFSTANFSPNKVFNKVPSRFQKHATEGPRSAVPLCKSCDRSFTHRQHLEEHINSHLKCDEKDCLFEASGKILKEHKLAQHGKRCGQASPAAQRAALLQSKESMDDIQQWREERKRNYPTEANIQHKAQVMLERRARGELIDEDTNKRQKRMREILAKQAELGFPVAEVPPHYIMSHQICHKEPNENGQHGLLQQDSDTSRKVPNNHSSYVKGKKSHHDETDEGKELVTGKPPLKIPRLEHLTSPRSVLNDDNSLKGNQSGEAIGQVKPASESQGAESAFLPPTLDRIDDIDKTEDLSNSGNNETAEGRRLQHIKGKNSKRGQAICRYFQRGYCFNGVHCKYLHAQKSDGSHKQTSVASEPSKRKPTLLEKLLSGEIKREKSHLLQVFRFMVNNSFFTEWPKKPLKFLHLSAEAASTNPEQAERRSLSYLGSNYGIGEEYRNLDNGDVTKKIVGGEGESKCGDDIEEGEIVEGEIQ